MDPAPVARAVDDEVLVARLRAGDDRALADAYDLYGGAVYATARRVTVDDDLARDVTQEVFVHVWEHPDRVDLDRGALRAYLRVMAHRRAVDLVRRVTRRAAAERSASAFEPLVVVPAFDDDVADCDAAMWSHGIVVDALAELPPEQRVAVTMAYVEGHTMRDVAACLGIPEGTAKSRVRLGVAHVRAAVAKTIEAAR